VAQMIASISSTRDPSVNCTLEDVSRAMPGRTWTLPDMMRDGSLSLMTTAQEVMSWFGCSPYRAWSKREFAALWK